MTRIDVAWRAAGLAAIGAGCMASLLDRDGSPRAILYFLLCIFGLVLLVSGKRVGIALKAERRGHCDTATVIHAERVRRSRNSPRS